jgi:hypothetical protein
VTCREVKKKEKKFRNLRTGEEFMVFSRDATRLFEVSGRVTLR